MQISKNKQKSVNNLRSKTQGRQQKSQKKSSLNPALLVQQAVINTTVTKSRVETRFEDMNLVSSLKNNILQLGYAHPTEIQDKTFSTLVDGSNLIGIAATGTGKTGAFLIPMIEKLLRNKDQKFQTLIMVPTRELALQVYDEFKKLAKNTQLTAMSFIGGTNVDADVRKLRNNCDFIIGTPGRLLDLNNRGSLKLNQFDVLILDEFDKMLDMGFIHDIRQITSKMNRRKQTLLFSATKDSKQQKIIDEIVQNPFIVEIQTENQSSKNVQQDIIKVNQGQEKFSMLLDLLSEVGFDKVILFTETKHLANRLSKRLNESGITSDQIHGNKSQNYRVNALDKFKKGIIRVLVATDVAARGIDINDVSLVVNYQVPNDFETYIHRVGRTGRAGKTGTAYTFVD